MSLLKISVLAVSIGAFYACASIKEKPEEINTIKTVETNKEEFESFEGVITNKYKDRGCSFLFAYTDKNGNKALVRPMQLDEKYQQDGIKVRIAFRLSRASNAGCDLANPVIIEKIELI